jgi:hypothetical protein
MTPTREAHARARSANNYPRNSIQQASGVLLKGIIVLVRLLAVQAIPKTSMFPFVVHWKEASVKVSTATSQTWTNALEYAPWNMRSMPRN